MNRINRFFRLFFFRFRWFWLCYEKFLPESLLIGLFFLSALGIIFLVAGLLPFGDIFYAYSGLGFVYSCLILSSIISPFRYTFPLLFLFDVFYFCLLLSVSRFSFLYLWG